MDIPLTLAEANAVAAGAPVLQDGRPTLYATLAEIISPAHPATTREEDYELGSGLIVRIRPLTRMEVILIGKRDLTTDQKEQAFLSKAMVLPAMTAEDVKRWQIISEAGEMQGLIERVQIISGLTDKGAKATAKEFPEPGQ